MKATSIREGSLAGRVGMQVRVEDGRFRLVIPVSSLCCYLYGACLAILAMA